MHAKRPNLAFAMLLALFGYLLPISLIQAATPAINLCVDDNFAPFEYASPASNSTAHVVRGATISMVERILNRHQISYSIKWLPWTRCLAYVKSGNIQIGMDAYYDARRDQDIAYSEPYYTLTPQYYYSRQRFPHGLGIKWRTNLKQYRGCGVLGYSYTHYGLGKSDIDSGAQDHATLIRKLSMGRCDYFVEELEVMQGYALTGTPYLNNPDLGHAGVPGVIAPKLHLIISRKTPSMQNLLSLLNREIIQMHKNGEMQQLVDNNLRQSIRGSSKMNGKHLKSSMF